MRDLFLHLLWMPLRGQEENKRKKLLSKVYQKKLNLIKNKNALLIYIKEHILFFYIYYYLLLYKAELDSIFVFSLLILRMQFLLCSRLPSSLRIHGAQRNKYCNYYWSTQLLLMAIPGQRINHSPTKGSSHPIQTWTSSGPMIHLCNPAVRGTVHDIDFVWINQRNMSHEPRDLSWNLRNIDFVFFQTKSSCVFGGFI